MAKKDDHELPDDSGLDDLGLGDLDFDNFMAGKSKKKGDRTPYHAAAESFLKTSKDRLVDRGFVRRMLSGVLPKGYTQALNTYDALDRGIADIIKDNRADLDPYLRKLKANGDRSQSALLKFLPKSVRDAVEKSGVDDGGSSYSRKSELDMNLEGMEALFKAQAAERMQDTYHDAVRDVRDQKRFELDMRMQAGISQGIGRLVGYQDNILIKYHRKNLELGYRQLDVQMKMFALQRESFMKNEATLEKIVENTALPDFAKMTHGEIIKQQLSSQLAAGAMNTVNNFTSKYFEGLKNNASGALGAGLQVLTQFKSLDGTGMSKSELAGDMLGQFAGEAAMQGVEYVLSMLSDTYGKKITGSKMGKKGDNFFRQYLSDIPQRLNEFAKSEGQYTGWKGLFEQVGKNMFDTYSPTSSIRGVAGEDLDKPAYMDNLFYKSVTEVMPGFMASMDRSLKVLVTGEDHEEAAYSHYSGGFVKRSVLDQQNLKLGLLKGGGDILRGQVDAILRKIGTDELSLDAKKALRRRLMTDLGSAHRFDPGRYVKIDTWRKEPEEIANELIEFFANKFSLDPSGKANNQTEEMKTHINDIGDKYRELQKRFPEFGEQMAKMSKVTGRRTWRDLGLSRYDQGSGDIIDLEKVFDMVVNSGDSVTPEDDEQIKKTLNPEQYRQLLLAREKKEKERQERLERGAHNDDVDIFKNGMKRNLGRAAAGGGPAPQMSVIAQIDWPEFLKTRDEETHVRLDRMIGLQGASSDTLSLIASLIPSAGAAVNRYDDHGPGPEGQGGGGGGDSDIDDAIQEQIDEIRRRWYDASIREGAGGLGRGLRKGAGALATGLGKYLSWSYGAIFGASSAGMKAAMGMAKLPFKKLDGFGVADIHRAGEEEPVMTAKDIRKGYYFDIESKKKVSKIADITGPVKDLRTDEVVLTQDDIDRGLYSGSGESLAGFMMRSGGKLAGMTARGVKAYLDVTYGTMWKVAKWTGKLALDQFTQFDAYFPGDEEPRIRSVLMKKGAYRNADGSPITSLKDIKGPVYEMDTEGNRKEIVSQEEIDKYKSFYTVNGSLLFTIGKATLSYAGRALSMAKTAATWYGKKAIGFYKGIGTILGKMGRGVKNFIMGRFKNGAVGALDDEMALAAVEIGAQQLQTQISILQFMQSRWDKENVHGDVDGDGERDWSWKDIIRRRKEKLAESMKGGATGDPGSEKVVEAIEKMNKDLDKKIDELKEVTEEAGENSWLEDAADLDDLADRGGKRGRGRGRPRPGGGAGKKGFIRRAGSWIAEKGSKYLNKAKKIPGVGWLTSGAAWAGRAAWAGATAAAPVIAEGAVALGGVISAPVVLGALAVGGIAYGGYKLYKSSEAQKFPLLYLRMTQYGVNPTDEKRVMTMIQLEGMVRRGTVVDQNGKATLDPGKMELGSILDLFDAESPERKNQLFSWIQDRFKPVYLLHCSAMMRIRKTTDLSSADTGIGDGDIETFLSTVDPGGMQKVYDDLAKTPFDSKLTEDSGDVESAIKMVRGRRKLLGEQAQIKKDQAVRFGNTEALAKTATIGVSANGTSDASSITKGLMIQESVKQGRLPLSIAGVTTGMNTKTTLDIPTAVRYITYGLVEMKLDKCIQLQQVEEIYWPNVTYVGTSKATLSGNMDDLEQRAMDIFKPANEPQKSDVQKWVRYRFLPAFLQYAISVRRRYNGDAKDAVKQLTGPDMRQVLNEVTQVMVDVPTGRVSVWKIANSPWPGEMLESMAGATSKYIEGLDTGDMSKVLDVKGMEAQKNQDPNDYGKSLTNIALGNQRANTSGTGTSQQAPTLANYAGIFGKGNVAGGARGQSIGNGDGSMLMAGGSGAMVKHPGGGTGGDINSLPNNTGKGMTAMGPVITAAAKMVGFDPDIALNVAAVESKMDPNASSGIAFGLFQFVSGTWGDMMRKYGATYGIAPNTPMTDPRANAILGACYLKENYEGLTGPLGGNVTDVDLYAAHFLGLGGAKKFLTAPPNDPASNWVGAKAISNNRSVFYGKGGLRTIAETKAELAKRIADGKKYAGVGGSTGSVIASKDENGNPTFTSSGGEGPGNEESGGPTTAGAATTALDAANAANGGASGTPAATQITPRPNNIPVPSDVASEVQGSAPGSGEFVETGGGAAPAFTPPPVAPQQTPSRVQAEQATKANYDQQASSQEAVTTLLGQQFAVVQNMDKTLMDIRTLLQDNRGQGSQGDQSAPQSQPAPQASEPLRKQPLNTRRQNAVI